MKKAELMHWLTTVGKDILKLKKNLMKRKNNIEYLKKITVKFIDKGENDSFLFILFYFMKFSIIYYFSSLLAGTNFLSGLLKNFIPIIAIIIITILIKYGSLIPKINKSSALNVLTNVLITAYIIR